MARWEPGSRGRLEQAALDLFEERGFENTTVADIAEAAGVTERTFFRQYADKREVLFAGQAYLHDLFVGTVADAAPDTAPIDAVIAAVEAAATAFEGRREHATRRAAVVAANPSLQERELIKMATLGAAIADALRERGVPTPAAGLVAELGIAVFRVAFERWVTDPESGDFVGLVRGSVDELRSVVASA